MPYFENKANDDLRGELFTHFHTIVRSRGKTKDVIYSLVQSTLHYIKLLHLSPKVWKVSLILEEEKIYFYIEFVQMTQIHCDGIKSFYQMP